MVNQDWFFLSHRLPIAVAARDAGMRVTVVAADTGAGDAIRAEGLEFIPIPPRHGDGTVMGELRMLAFLARLYRRIRPDLIHHVTVRPVLYGSLAARVVPRASVVNAISGLGYVFTEGADRARSRLRRVVEALYRAALRRPRTRTIFQNPDDLDQFLSNGLVRRQDALLIRGSGVDCRAFTPTPPPDGPPIVMLPARMLRDKGVTDFVAAARLLRAQGVQARFVLAGDPYAGNPSSIPEAELRGWEAEGVVEWWGHQSDMPAVLAQSSVVVLPTKREGLPKALLEAAAAARPMVATDVPGCREVVRSGVNGTLVPPEDPAALSAAIGQLVADPALRRRYGTAARRMAEAEFRVERVVGQTLDLYRDLLVASRRSVAARRSGALAWLRGLGARRPLHDLGGAGD